MARGETNGISHRRKKGAPAKWRAPAIGEWCHRRAGETASAEMRRLTAHDYLVAEPAIIDAAADRIAAAQPAVAAAWLGGRDQGRAVVLIFAKLIGGLGFEALTSLGATAGLAALMLKAAGVEVVVLGIALALAAAHLGQGRHRQAHRAQQSIGADPQPKLKASIHDSPHDPV